MKKFRASRLKQLIFPQELTIDQYHAMTRKRRFPAFWVVKEESIPLSKLASIQVERGMFFSKLIIENSGGLDPITITGLWNSAAREARDLLEMIEREQFRGDIASLVGDDDHPRPQAPTSGPNDSRGSGGGGQDRKDRSNRNEASLPPAMVRTWQSPAPVPVPIAARAQFIPPAMTRPPQQVPTVAQSPRLDFERQSPAIHAACEMKSRPFGQVPSDDWTPPVPWAPRLEENEERDFLSDISEMPELTTFEPTMEEPSVAVVTYEPESANPIEKLTDWWQNTKGTFTLPEIPIKGKRRRKLN